MKMSKDDKRRIITLVGVKQARKGLKFLHEKSSEKCENCEYYKVCIGNLETGRVYKIVKLRDKVFPCPIHEGGVKVVEVVESEIFAAISEKMALEGAVIIFHPEECENISCKYKNLCFPTGLYMGDRCEIVKVEDKIECEKGLQLVKAELKRIVVS